MEVGDVVKYYGGSRIYKVTQIGTNKRCTLDGKYSNIQLSSLKVLNKYSEGYKFSCKGTLYESTVEKVYWNAIENSIYYDVAKLGGPTVCLSEFQINEILKNYENRLQEQENSNSGGIKSRPGRELCCRSEVYVKLGHRGNKYSINKSKEQAERSYEHLPLGQQKISRCENGSGGIPKESGLSEGVSKELRNDELNISDFIDVFYDDVQSF